MSAQSIVNSWLADRQKELIQNYDALGLRASGNWANQLEVKPATTGPDIKAGILGADYTEQLENGRRPNQNSSEEAIKAWVGWAGNTIIKQWVEDKGLDISPFAVAYKIAREGWKVPNKFNAGGLVSDVITDQKLNELNRELSIFYVAEIKSAIIKKFK
jgi:hypothetical protein